jgi:PAS domain S-box-containing protein
MTINKPKILILCRSKEEHRIFKKIKFVEWLTEHDWSQKHEKNFLGIIIILNNKRCCKNLKKIFANYPDVPKYGIISARLKQLESSLLRQGFNGIEELPLDNEKLNRIVTSMIWGKKSIEDKSFNIFIREILAHAINSKSEHQVIKRIAEGMLGIFKADRVSIMLLDPRTNTLTIKSAVGIPDRVFKQGKRKLGEKIAGWVAERNLPVLLKNGLVADERFRDVKGNPGIKSSIIVPLTFANNTIGVINIARFKGDEFIDEEKDKAALYSSFIALLIHQLKELERIEFLNKAVNNTNEGIIIIDSAGRILMLNRGAERILGVRFDEVFNKDLLEVVNLEIDRNEIKRIINGGSISNMQMNYTGPDDGQKILLLSGSSVFAPERTRIGAIFVLRELTHFIELHRDKLNVEKLHELTRWIDEISHQMNNPLSVIMGNIHLINDSIKPLSEIRAKQDAVKYYDKLFSEIKKMLSEINEASERMNVFIKALKNFQIDSEIHWERCFFADLIDRAIDIAEIENVNDVQVIKKFSYNPIILCVRDKIIGVLVTLLKNAFAQSIKEDKINITLRKGHDVALFEMSCAYNPEMHKEEQKEGHMETFYSMLDIPAGFWKGYGLVSSVVNMHQGKIGFEISDKKDLTIRLELKEHE